MSLTCQLSGQVPAEPVVDKQGHFFERRVIEAQLDKSTRCPIDGEALEKKDLISITQRPTQVPSSAYANDLPSHLRAIQEHVDGQAIECERLRIERDDLRKAMTRTMYLRDAATAALARKMDRLEFLEKENMELQKQISEGELKRKVPRLEDQASVPFANTLDSWSELSKTLLKVRKMRVVKARPLEEIKRFDIQDTQTVSVDRPTSMALVLAAHDSSRNICRPHIIAIASEAGVIEVRDIIQKKSLATLTGHDSPISSIISLVYPSGSHLPPSSLSHLGASSSTSSPFKSCINLISADLSGQINVWRESTLKAMENIDWMDDVTFPMGSAKCSKYMDTKVPSALNFSHQIINLARGPITGLKLHPAGTHVGVVTNTSQGWSLVDLPHSNVARVIEDAPTQICDIAFQPDGLVVIGAGEGVLPVWDLRIPRLKAQCKPVNSSVLLHFTSIAFSEAGYYMATATQEGKGHLWDLRKNAVVQEYDVQSSINTVHFDHSGSHLVFSSDDGVKLFSTKEKKNMILVAEWGKGKIVDSQFDFLTDDYLITLGNDGMLATVYDESVRM